MNGDRRELAVPCATKVRVDVTRPISRIPLAELRKIPFLDIENLNGRIIPSLCFYDGKDWHFWFPHADRLTKVKAEPSEADYFGRAAERDSDMSLEFLNFMAQRAYWPTVAPLIDAIRDDIHNLGASLQKFHLFHRCSADEGIDVARFVSTEVEYLFGASRSLLDLLQEVVGSLWDLVPLFDQSIKKRHLPKSFDKMIAKDGRPMSAEEIRDRFKVPQELAQFYERAAPFFTVLRDYRNNIIHRGKKVGTIFVTEKGFAVFNRTEPFASFRVWNEAHMLPNKLASLRPVLAHVVLETIRCCEDFARTIQRSMQFPPDVAPGFRLFSRGYHNEELRRLNEVKDNVLWWDA